MFKVCKLDRYQSWSVPIVGRCYWTWWIRGVYSYIFHTALNSISETQYGTTSIVNMVRQQFKMHINETIPEKIQRLKDEYVPILCYIFFSLVFFVYMGACNIKLLLLWIFLLQSSFRINYFMFSWDRWRSGVFCFFCEFYYYRVIFA